jgi:hypothetical protein
MNRELYQAVKTASLVCALGYSSAVAAHAAVTPQIQALVTNSIQELQTYNSTHSFAALESAIETLSNSVDTDKVAPGDYVAFRRTIMQAWSNIMKAIEQSYDPTYDPNNPNDRPNLCVQPPGGISCNASPNEIQDPKVRAEYEAALNANALKEQRASHWQHVHLLDELAMSSLQADLQIFATARAPSDFAALDAIFRQAGIRSSRMAKIDTMLMAPAPQTHP